MCVYVASLERSTCATASVLRRTVLPCARIFAVAPSRGFCSKLNLFPNDKQMQRVNGVQLCMCAGMQITARSLRESLSHLKLPTAGNAAYSFLLFFFIVFVFFFFSAAFNCVTNAATCVCVCVCAVVCCLLHVVISGYLIPKCIYNNIIARASSTHTHSCGQKDHAQKTHTHMNGEGQETYAQNNRHIHILTAQS